MLVKKLKHKIILGCIFSSSWFFAQPTNVLFIGNSFTHMHSLCKIYENLANSKGKQVFGDTIAVSGSTLKGHTEREYTYKKMKTRKWDYAFIQGLSRELSYDSTTIVRETIPYAQQLIDSLRMHNPCVTIYYFMTWGYADGNSDSVFVDTYEDMQLRISKGYKQLSQATGDIPIAPVGMVWREFRSKYPEVNLYETDKIHPNPNGSYIAANTFYNIIYNESSVNSKYPKKVAPEVAEAIQKIASKYVLENGGVFDSNKVQFAQNAEDPSLDFDMSVKWLSVTLKNKTQGGSEFFWEFGDGTNSKQSNPKHYFPESGTYNVVLHVKKNCQWYQLTKSVKVVGVKKKAPKKP